MKPGEVRWRVLSWRLRCPFRSGGQRALGARLQGFESAFAKRKGAPVLFLLREWLYMLEGTGRFAGRHRPDEHLEGIPLGDEESGACAAFRAGSGHRGRH